MKKALAVVLSLILVFALAACGGGGASSGGTAGASSNGGTAGSTGGSAPQGGKSFKIGLFDLGSTNATTTPLQKQLELTINALGGEVVWGIQDMMDPIPGLQNLISSGVDGIICSATAGIDQVAKLCDDAGVYWSTYWNKMEPGDGNYEAAIASPYFISTSYEDDVYSAYFAGKQLGEAGCKNLCLIGLPAGAVTSIMRDEGLQRALDEYGMTVLAEERDFTMTITTEGGATTTERFLTAYPECDGIVIVGMTQFVLAGVVQTLEQYGKVGEIPVAGIDFNEHQTDYFERGALIGIVGGHFSGPIYSAILMANKINDTPLTDEPAFIENNFIELTSYEESKGYDDAMDATGFTFYPADVLAQCLVANNPSFTYDDLMAMRDAYGLDYLLKNAG